MVDVTVLLYLPINTSLDDLAFVADWGQKIVAQAEEKMIINGKNTRYLRQRVMPMMYNPNNNIRPLNKPKTRENTESWLKLLRKQDKEALPSWVKNHNLIDQVNAESPEENSNSERSASPESGHESDTASTSDSVHTHDHPDGLCDCAVNRKNYLDVIREAVQFTYPTPPSNMSQFSGSQGNLLDSDDSIFSDASSDDDPDIDPKLAAHMKMKMNRTVSSESATNNNNKNSRQRRKSGNGSLRKINKNNRNLLGSNSSIDSNNSKKSTDSQEDSVYSMNSTGSAGTRTSRNSAFSNKSKYSSYSQAARGTGIPSSLSNSQIMTNNTHRVTPVTSGTMHDASRVQSTSSMLSDSLPSARTSSTTSAAQKLNLDLKNLNVKSTSQHSYGSRSDISSNLSSSRSTHTISNNKHVILSVAMGYDRDSMKEVRKVINETGVALLSVGIGDRGMIGLGGYYIKKLHELESKSLQDKLIQRLWNLA